MKKLVLVSVFCSLVAGPALAQMQPAPAAKPAAPANPMVAGTMMAYGMAKGNLTKAADQMPESLYAFKATPDVRSFGQIVGHVADANYMICAAAAGEKPPVGDVEKTKTAKADLSKALGESFAYCDKIFASMTDAEGAKMVPFFGNQQAKLSVLAFNAAHDMEHYGNIVTYMRLNKMVPPSSQGR